MESILELKSIWEDDDLFEVNIIGSNGKFSGSANCYTQRTEILDLASALDLFPKSQEHEVKFSTGENDGISYFSICFKCYGKTWKTMARIKIVHIATYLNAPQEYYLTEFDLPFEPAELDKFVQALQVLAAGEVGKHKATLKTTI